MAFKKRLPLYYQAAIIASLGGFLFGLDTGTIGPVTAMSSFTHSFGRIEAGLHGIIVSSILIGGAAAGLVAGNVGDAFGRTTSMMIGALIFGFGAGLETGSINIAMFITGRIIAGIGEGLFLGNVMTYVTEIAPARRRGRCGSLVQFAVTVGIATGYFISYGTARMKSSSASWRTPLAFQALVAFAFAAACLAIPPSPRWLVAKGRKEEALATLERLDVDAEELEEMAVPELQTPISHASLLMSIRDHLREMTQVFGKDARKQTALACIMMGMQQLSGIDGVLYYAPLLFQQAGLASEEASFLASGVSALVMLVVTIPASIYVDHWGRRASTISGGILLSACMMLIGSLYAGNAVHGDRGAARWIVIVAIFIFGVAFCMTWAIGIRIYSSEIQPSRTRAGATSLAQSANWVTNWLVAFTTPILLSKSSSAAYFLFGGCTIITVFICYFFMPETKGKSLEAIEKSFVTQRTAVTPLTTLKSNISRLRDGVTESDCLPRGTTSA